MFSPIMEFAMAQSKYASLLNAKFSLNKQICIIRRCVLTNKPYFDHYSQKVPLLMPFDKHNITLCDLCPLMISAIITIHKSAIYSTVQ